MDNSSDLITSLEYTSEDPDIETLKNRMKEIEEETQLIRQIQRSVEKQMNMSTSKNTAQSSASIEAKIETDSRSVYVGNVDYCSTAEELKAHFYGCGSIKRVTILTDKFTGHPKGYVCAKRTNRPGVSITGRPSRAGGRRGVRVIVKYIYAGYRAKRLPSFDLLQTPWNFHAILNIVLKLSESPEKASSNTVAWI
ncbi:unnamed protein product [Onchocerca ochengi]|uniref:RRM domain-containing protein n=1 Tax=Onchocerca ochengi TaxID=42157 RepID=A0A182DXG9_ONCOC|nr:unnamed protein product [Onchocerca ochengi]